MMFDWYQIFNLDEFQNADLVSRTYTKVLTGRGEVEVLVLKGIVTSVQFDGEFMPIQFGGQNPYVSGNYAVFIDVDDNVWLGYRREDLE
jgi:hypothetical protein